MVADSCFVLCLIGQLSPRYYVTASRTTCYLAYAHYFVEFMVGISGIVSYHGFFLLPFLSCVVVRAKRCLWCFCWKQRTKIQRPCVCASANCGHCILLDNGWPLDVIVPGALYVPSMDLRILSIDQWARSRTRKRTDKCKDYTHMVTTPDEDRSTVFINKNRKRFAIPHSNGLAKCRCSYPNAPMKVKSHFCSEEYDCCHYIY